MHSQAVNIYIPLNTDGNSALMFYFYHINPLHLYLLYSMYEGWEKITPEQVLTLSKPLDAFACPITANIYNIIFGRFKIRNIEKGITLFDIVPEVDEYNYAEQSDEIRYIEYTLPLTILKSKAIGTTVEFKVGGKEAKNFRMIERHYFKGNLLKSFDFKFGFCIPNSTNTWESIYEPPVLTEQELKDIVLNPVDFRSDSFYFVDNKLIMHHRASYRYVEN